MRVAVVEALQPGGLWTDPRGVVHIRSAGTGRTYCGTPVGPYTSMAPTSGCDGCVSASTAAYARHHICGRDCGE